MALPQYITPTVKKAQVYDARTGQLIQQEGPFSTQEMDRGAGKFGPAPGSGGVSSVMRSHTPMEGKRSIGVTIGGGGGMGGGGTGGAGRGGFGGGVTATYNPYAGLSRIGNKGGVMAPPSPNALEANGRQGMGSMEDFYATRATDPITGLRLRPSANEVMQNQAKLQGAFGNQSDFQKLGATDAYYGGRASGNPYMAMAGAQAIQSLNAQRAQDAARQQASTTTGQNNDGSIDFRKFDGGVNPMAKAKGGDVDSMNPYIVGEKGPELFVSKNGDAEIIGAAGPELRTFGIGGTVIPNHKIKERRDGGKVSASMGAYQAPSSVWNLWNLRNPFINPFSAAPAEASAAYLTGVPEYPSAPPVPNLPSYRSTHPFEPSVRGGRLAQDEYQFAGEETPDEFNPLVRQAQEGSSAIPSYAPRSGQGWLNPYLMLLASAPQRTGTAGPVADVRSRMTNPIQTNALTGKDEMAKPVMALSEPQSTKQAFQTPYGKASVTFGAPKKEAVIEGLPASEWFQRAANRQGANKYAKPEKGYMGVK